MTSLHYLSINELSERMRRKQTSPLEVVNAALERIERLAPELNAFITVLADSARQKAEKVAEEIDSGTWRGPLHGIPVDVKDFYDTADAIGSCRLPTACCGVVGFKGTYGLISAKGILDGEKGDEAIVWMSHLADRW